MTVLLARPSLMRSMPALIKSIKRAKIKIRILLRINLIKVRLYKPTLAFHRCHGPLFSVPRVRWK